MIASGEGATRFHYFQYYPKKTSLPRCLLYYQFRFVEQAKEADKSAIKTHHQHNIGHATNKYYADLAAVGERLLTSARENQTNWLD